MIKVMLYVIVAVILLVVAIGFLCRKREKRLEKNFNDYLTELDKRNEKLYQRLKKEILKNRKLVRELKEFKK